MTARHLVVLAQQRLVDECRPLHLIIPMCASNEWIGLLLATWYNSLYYGSGLIPSWNRLRATECLLRSFPPLLTHKDRQALSAATIKSNGRSEVAMNEPFKQQANIHLFNSLQRYDSFLKNGEEEMSFLSFLEE